MIAAQPEESNNNGKQRIILIAATVLLLCYSGFTALKITERNSSLTAKKSEVDTKQKKLTDLKGNQNLGLVEALLKEDSTDSIARFSQTIARISAENGVLVQRMNTSSGQTIIAGATGKPAEISMSRSRAPWAMFIARSRCSQPPRFRTSSTRLMSRETTKTKTRAASSPPSRFQFLLKETLKTSWNSEIPSC
jgi:hypothetical protein